MKTKEETEGKISPALVSWLVCCATGAGVGAAFGQLGFGTVIGFNVGAAVGLFWERNKMKPVTLGVCVAALAIAFSLYLITR
jgi:hypothetical protein